jgi:hypothetical protein
MRVNNKQYYLKMYVVHQNGLSTVLVKLAFANTLQDDIANSGKGLVIYSYILPNS